MGWLNDFWNDGADSWALLSKSNNFHFDSLLEQNIYKVLNQLFQWHNTLKYAVNGKGASVFHPQAKFCDPTTTARACWASSDIYSTCVYIHSEWCADAKISSHFLSLVEYMTVKNCPFYLQREFTTIIIVAVFIPPSTNTRETICSLQRHQQTSNSSSWVNFFQIYQHVSLATRGLNPLVYTNNICDSYKASTLATETKFRWFLSLLNWSSQFQSKWQHGLLLF